MAKVSNRLDKIADLLKKELAVLIQKEVRDPRVGMVSVTAAKVTRDLAWAEIYVTILGTEQSGTVEEGVEVLNHAAGYLRSLLAKNLNLRTTPKLRFLYDDSIVRGSRLSSLIDQAVALEKHDRGDDTGNF